MQPNRYCLIAIRLSLLLLFFGNSIYSQPGVFLITGVVKDRTSSPVSGVQIQISNTRITTSTKADGSFSLRVPQQYMSEKIIYSIIGYSAAQKNISRQQTWEESFDGFTIQGRTKDLGTTIIFPPPLPKDSDGDGVPDDTDRCPNTPGLSIYNGCPIPDDDKDGIPDEIDKCPTIAGLEKYQGCPEADISSLKIFPIPYPKPSAVYAIPWSEITVNGEKTFASVDAKITQALTSSGYHERSYYYIPHGFALVTQIEKINIDGTCKSEPARWELKVDAPKSFLEYLNSFINAPTGYFRIVVFLVTDINLTAGTQTVDRNVATGWVENGYAKLPNQYHDLAFTKNHSVTTVIYEFKKVQGQPPAQTTNRLPGRTHLDKSQIAKFLK